MKINFDITIPNEPYINDVSEGKKITFTYTGYPHLVISVNPNNNTVVAVDYKGDEEKELNDFEDDELVFYKIAVNSSNVLAASLLTKDYTNPELVYEDNINDDEKWNYVYDQNNALGDIFERTDGITYDSKTGTFDTNISFLSHPVSEESFLEGIATKTTEWKEIQAAGDLDDATQAEVDEYVSWLENAPTKYNGIAHWKWPYPAPPAV